MEKPKKKSRSWFRRLASEDLVVEHGQIVIEEETEIEKQKNWFRRRTAVTILPLLFLVIVGWLAASIYMPKIRFGGSLVSAHQSDVALQDIIKARIADFKLTFVYPDKSQKNYSPQELGLKVNPATTVTHIRDQQRRLVNRLQWWHPLPGYLAIDSDSKLLESFVTQHATVTVQPAKDATLSIVDGEVRLSNSVSGKHHGLIDPLDTLNDAVSNLRSNTLNLQTLSTRPAITSTQLASSQSKLKSVLGQNVTFTTDGKKVQASSSDIAEWLELTPKNSGRDVSITVNSGKVLEYINKISANAIHPPKAQVEIVRSEGSTDVLVAGINGTDVINKSDAANAIAQTLLEGKGIQQDLSVKYAAYQTIKAQAYDKWIEVDTTNKRMYAYEQGDLIKTFLVSAGAPKTPTVTGQFAIYAKYAQQDMHGQNVDGSSYFQPNVPWVSYFYADFAIHGNYWRPLDYFGNVNSSHGCVGVVDSDAQWVYSWAPIGTPVIVHT